MRKIVIGAKTLAESLFSPIFALMSVILIPKIHSNHITNLLLEDLIINQPVPVQ